MKVNALAIRQKLGKILKQLEELDEPIIVEKGRKPVAVLISMETFKRRFVDYQQEQIKAKLLEEFKRNASKVTKDSLTVLREMRYG
ncbi:MAG: type II toxin-antitoxin system Phd/YefM family antitoxin [Deltaproteobacteria bacterium]|nr:type II toxin-antitoxin system Phd/YefM family antitoxin [Deltaproteobacteria bacterium]